MRVPRHLTRRSDLALAALLVTAGVVQVLVTSDTATSAVAGSVWMLVLTLPVAVRRQWPVGVVVVGSVAGLAHLLLTTADTPLGAEIIALLLTFYTAGAHASLRHSSVALLVALAAFWSQDAAAGHPPSEYFASLVLVAGPWLAGVGVRRVREQNRRLAGLVEALQRERNARAEDAVLAERARIARDLHDVVGHGLSVIALQAQAAEAALESDPSRVGRPVAAILATTRTTMVEMRRLVDVLGSAEESAPAAGLARLPGLVDEHRASGLDVLLTIPPAPCEVPAGVEVAVYRIVQEALTNVRRHSAARSARVDIHLDQGVARVTVHDPGPTAERLGEVRGGFGLGGVSARAESCGGIAQAGPDAGGWTLTVRLPYEPLPSSSGASS